MMHLFPSRADPGELRFVHSQAASLIIGLVGAAAAVLMWMLMDDGPVTTMFVAGAALTAFRFLTLGLRRYELVIEIEPRRWRRSSGLFFAPRTDTGSLDDLRGVALGLRHYSSGSGSSRRSIPMWSVSLEFEGPQWDGAALVIGLIDDNEARAYRLLEHYARKLRVDAVDRTALEPSRRSWDALERSGPEREARAAGESMDAAFASATPPPGSGIEVGTGEDEGLRIVLPAHGASIGVVLGGILGVLSIAAGAVFAISGLGFGPFAGDSGVEAVTVVVGSVFVWTGIGVIGAALSRARSREWIIELPDSLRFGVTRNGTTKSWTELPKRSIEEVSVRTSVEGGGRLYIMGVRIRSDPAKEASIRVRTDEDLVRLGGRLTPEAKQWLRDTIATSAGVEAG